MTTTYDLHPGLREKLDEIHAESATTQGFTRTDWLLLGLTGIVFPLLLIWWGAT